MVGVAKRVSIKFLIVAAALLNACCMAIFVASSLPTLHSTARYSNLMIVPATSNGIFVNSMASNMGIIVDKNLSMPSSSINEAASSFTLSYPPVSPQVGSQNTYFTFIVYYTNPSNSPPSYVQLVIISGSNYTYYLQKFDYNDNIYTDGCEYYCTIILPQGTGTYAYCFIARCGNTTVQTSITAGPTLSPVTISSLAISPTSGDTNTQFTFTVQYIDANNYPPWNGVNLVIDGNTYSMAKQDSNDNYYLDGCTYTYSTQLSTGSHWYYVYCLDESSRTIQTSSSSITVQSSTVISDPGPAIATALICLGAFMSILIPALAHNIRVKKSVLAFGPPTNHPSPPSGSNMIPVPGMLPRSAFVQQPLQVPATTSSPLSPPAIPAAPVQPPVRPTETILPGSPKWARLARFDISQYMAPVDNHAIPIDDGDNVKDENIQDGIRITRTNVEASIEPVAIPAASASIEKSAMQATAMSDEEMIPAPENEPDVDDASIPSQGTEPTREEGNVLYIGRAEFEKNSPTEPVAPIQLTCTECGTRLEASGINDDLVYFCKKCQKAMVMELSCPKCFGKTTMAQDEMFSPSARASRCPVCFEALFPIDKNLGS